MEDVDFVCTTKECNQKVFIDEKQLISHKRKHDMVLSLNKSNPFPSDDTPTPTRFLRNCEAIGLFQDLQNLNPFDETFKKAAEAAKKGEIIQTLNISTLGKAAGEDLHTPHIDLTAEAQSSNDGIEDQGETVIRTEADTSLKSVHPSPHKVPLPVFEDGVIKDKAKSNDQDLRLFVRMPDGSLVQIPTMGNHLGIAPTQSNDNASRTIIISTQNSGSEVNKKFVAKPQPTPPRPLPINNSSTASAVVRQKLKAALLKTTKSSHSINQVVSSHSTTLLNNNNDSPVTEVRREKRVSSTTIEEDHERKLKTLERNRIAAMRCREKRKKWVADLREKYDKMCNTNDALVKEVSFLRSEVVRLKSALLLACNQPPHPVQDVTATTVQIVTNGKILPRFEKNPLLLDKGPLMLEKDPLLHENKLDPTLSSGGRGARGALKLDIEGAASISVMDLDSPLVRRDEILTSVAPPTTPNEKLISFPELDRVECEASEEKMLSSVIQINPNALSKLPSAFS